MKKILFFASVVFAFVACQKNNDVVLTEESYEIRATIDNDYMTKVSLSGLGTTETSELKNVWNYGDKLYLFTNSGESDFPWNFIPYEINNVTSGHSVEEGYFIGSVAPEKVIIDGVEEYAAVVIPPTSSLTKYPSQTSYAYAKFVLPGTQYYKSNSVKEGYLCMFGTGSTPSNMKFKSIVSLLRVRVKDTSNNGEGVVTIKLSPDTSQGIYGRGFAGMVYFDCAKAMVPKNVDYVEPLPDNNDHSVTLVCNDSTNGDVSPIITASYTDFYIVISPNSLSGPNKNCELTVTTDKSTRILNASEFCPRPGKIYTVNVDLHPAGPLGPTSSTIASIDNITFDVQ